MHRRLLCRPFGRAVSRFAVGAFSFSATATVPVALGVVSVVGFSTAAVAQTEASEPFTPGKGELVVVGKTLAVMPAENRLAVSVTQVVSPDGAIIDLHPPVSKSIVLSSATSYRLMSDARQKVRLSDIKPGTRIRAVGVTKGPGSPLAARAVAIEADGDFDQQALWQTMPPTQTNSWWLFRVKEPAEAHTFIEDKAYKVTVAVPGAMPSSVQIIQGGLKLQNGQKWHLRFRAKASPARRVRLSAMVGSDDFHSVGLREEIQMEPDWRDYDYTFAVSKASETGKNQCPALSIGDKAGTVWISGMLFEEVKETKETKDAKEEPKSGTK